MFITFEGIDGCGKTTQLLLLKEYLESKGHQVITLREPGGTILSEEIREILLSHKSKISDISELLLFEAARANLVEEIIKPALQKDIFVLSDRFYDSTVAYQGFGRQINLDIINSANNIAINGVKPNLTFYFKVSLETAKNRSRKREQDRIEKAGDDFFNRIIFGYDEIAKNEPNRIKVINAELDIEHIKNQIIENIKNFNKIID